MENGKSAVKLYTTGEIAKEADVTIRTIRYYDTKGILKPSYHNSAGHRLYTQDDFIKLKRILALKYLGLSLEEVMTIEESTFKKKDIVNSLKLQKRIIKNKINHMKTVVDAIETAENSIISDNIVSLQKTVDIIQILENEKEVRQQFIDESNLNALIKLQDKFSLDKDGWYRWIFKNLNLKKSMKVLEIGCGNGALWRKNLEDIDKTIELTLTDISEELINESKMNLKDNLVKVKYEKVDLDKLPYDGESFDIVIANHILFYIKDIDKILFEISRVIKKGGYLYSSTIGNNNMRELEELLLNYNKNINVSSRNLYSRFGEGNGKEILKRHFSRIEERLYKDKLVVDDTKELLEYIYSIPSNILEVVESKKKEFEKYIDKKINNEESKALFLTHANVLFKAKKF